MKLDPVRVGIVLGVVLGLLGCERLRDVKRCRELARRVNTSLDTVAQMALDGGNKPSTYDGVSREYAALATSLDGFDGGTPELVKAVGEYAALARTSGRQAAALASALGTKDRSTATVVSHEFERLARHEKSLAARIDDECRPK